MSFVEQNGSEDLELFYCAISGLIVIEGSNNRVGS